MLPFIQSMLLPTEAHVFSLDSRRTSFPVWRRGRHSILQFCPQRPVKQPPTLSLFVWPLTGRRETGHWCVRVFGEITTGQGPSSQLKCQGWLRCVQNIHTRCRSVRVLPHPSHGHVRAHTHRTLYCSIFLCDPLCHPCIFQARSPESHRPEGKKAHIV